MARYINADYALIALKAFNDKENGNPHFLNGIETAKEIIEELPTADVRENVKGEWLPEDNSDYYNWKCSVCGYGLSEFRTSYCCDCGADMRSKYEQQG